MITSDTHFSGFVLLLQLAVWFLRRVSQIDPVYFFVCVCPVIAELCHDYRVLSKFRSRRTMALKCKHLKLNLFLKNWINNEPCTDLCYLLRQKRGPGESQHEFTANFLDLQPLLKLIVFPRQKISRTHQTNRRSGYQSIFTSYSGAYSGVQVEPELRRC